MQTDYDALIQNKTWSLVTLPPNSIPIGCKWVFQVKENSDSTVNMYKARVVANILTKALSPTNFELYTTKLSACDSSGFPKNHSPWAFGGVLEYTYSTKSFYLVSTVICCL